jgi:hypothetical protein
MGLITGKEIDYLDTPVTTDSYHSLIESTTALFTELQSQQTASTSTSSVLAKGTSEKI